MENEHDLILQIIDGRSELFEPIVLQYQNLIYTICLNIVNNGHDAENMAQETFIAAYRSLSGYRGGDFKAWLCKIAVNRSIDYKRRQLKRPDTEELAAGAAELPAAGTVEEQVEQNERREQLNGILESIPEKYTSVVRAFYFNRLTVKEIAQRLKMPEKTVETRLYRAKKLIRERWGEDGF